MKLEIKMGPVRLKHGLNEFTVEEISFRGEYSLEEIPVLANEVKDFTKFFIEESNKLREVKIDERT